jgi:integrase
VAHLARHVRVPAGETLTDQRLSDQSVALIVKRRARTAGVPAAELSGHSLRAGYATAAAAGGRRGAQDRQRHPAAQEPPRPAPLHPHPPPAFDDVGDVL